MCSDKARRSKATMRFTLMSGSRWKVPSAPGVNVYSTTTTSTWPSEPETLNTIVMPPADIVDASETPARAAIATTSSTTSAATTGGS